MKTPNAPTRRIATAIATLLCLALAGCALKPPISLGKKESAVGQGMVISITNTSDEHLHEVVLDIVSPAGESKQFSIPTLNPHESMNVGWLKLEGWPIPEGSKVTASCKGYALSVGPFEL
ncbi:MAG: hypothetical protein AAF657_24620 [Acidobacteriota bacterium]